MIILNTLTHAVSHYALENIQSVTATHAAGPSGLHALSGDDDNGEPIIAAVKTPRTLRSNSTLKKAIKAVYASVQAEGCLDVEVFGSTDHWRYQMFVRPSGQSRCVVGRGIRENYLGFGLSNPAGQAFRVDRMEVLEATSVSRRI